MSRIIKFRAWCRLDKKVEFIHFDLLESKEFDWDIFDEKPIFQQFTGLKDRNGKEIYEGDILKYDYALKNSQGHDIIKINNIFTVDYNGSSFYVVNTNDKEESYPLDTCRLSIYKIIGNIFQNPELLNSPK